MKILLLNQTFHPDVMATGQYLSEVAVHLAQRGHQVTVVTSRRAYDNPRVRFPRQELWQHVTILRVPSPGFGKSAKWRRAVDFGGFLLGCCLRVAMLPRHEVIVALTSPPLISAIGACLARLWHARFVYWVMDLNPDEAIAAGWLQPDSIAATILDRISRFSLKRSASIVALDRFMADRLAAKGISPGRIRIIPPWIQEGEARFDASGRERFRQNHGLRNKFVVMYSGNHSPCHPLDTLLAAAQRFRNDPTIAFCCVGGGSQFARVQEFAANHRLSNVLCLPYQPLGELAGSLSAADLHVVVMGEAFVGIVHPCKIYNLLSVSAPILFIGPRPSHVSEILETVGPTPLNAWAPHGDVDRVTEHIRALRDKGGQRNPALAPEVCARFGRQTLLSQLINELERPATPAS